jgi:hypothetical protein
MEIDYENSNYVLSTVEYGTEEVYSVSHKDGSLMCICEDEIKANTNIHARDEYLSTYVV